jgi:hypothetical protein
VPVDLTGGEIVVKKIYLFEEKCCGVSVAEPLVNFLRSELGDEADVRMFDLSHPEELTPLPPSLFFKLMSEGSKCLPAMTVDSLVVAEGWLPDRAKILEIVASGRPASRSIVSDSAVAGDNVCCCTASECC